MPYTFPELSQVCELADVVSYDSSRLVLPEFMPEDTTTYIDSPSAIAWDIMAPVSGMTAVSDLDATPTLVDQRAITKKTCAPIILRESINISEAQLTNQRRAGSEREREGMQNLVFRAIDELGTRINTRIEALNFQALTGTVQVGDRTIDMEIPDSNKPNVSSTSGFSGHYWGTEGADIYADIAAACELLRGRGVSDLTLIADQSVFALMAKDKTFSEALWNSHLMPGRGTDGIAAALPAYMGCGLAKAVISTQSYIGDDGNIQSFCPKNKVFILGKPARGRLGCFASTVNAVNIDKGGRYFEAIQRAPITGIPGVTVVSGIHGVPVLLQPGAVVCMQVKA